MPAEPDMSDKFVGEEALLDQQAAEARAAFEQTLNELKQSLRDSAKLKVWAKRYPWAVAGAAAAGGFLLATAICSPRGAAAAAEPQPTNGQPTGGQPTGGAPPPHAPPHTGWLAWIIAPLIELIKPMLGQWLSSFAASAMGATSAPVANQAESPGRQPDEGREGPMPV
jgi:hypothetical protein